MSRTVAKNNNFLQLLLLGATLCCLSSAAYAEESSKDSLFDLVVKDGIRPEKPAAKEVIYRVNLGRADDVEILLKKGADVNEVNDEGVPILSLAAARTDGEGVKIVKLLTEAGADVNKIDRRGQNALFYAAKVGNKEAADYLLGKDVRYTATDVFGNSARVVAYQTGHNDIVESMDAFVRDKNEVIRQQYIDINKRLEETYKNYGTATQQNSINAVAAAQDGQSPVEVPPIIPEDAQSIARDAAFASCAAAYWQVCAAVSQQTELGTQGIADNIKSQTDRMQTSSDILTKERKIPTDIVQNLVSSADLVIKQELFGYKYNEVRKINKVGTLNDMTKRCGIIADALKASPRSDFAVVRKIQDPEPVIKPQVTQQKPTTPPPPPASPYPPLVDR